jgi:hypothetical protein
MLKPTKFAAFIVAIPLTHKLRNLSTNRIYETVYEISLRNCAKMLAGSVMSQGA